MIYTYRHSSSYYIISYNIPWWIGETHTGRFVGVEGDDCKEGKENDDVVAVEKAVEGAVEELDQSRHVRHVLKHQTAPSLDSYSQTIKKPLLTSRVSALCGGFGVSSRA